jgi:hypothetical protein
MAREKSLLEEVGECARLLSVARDSSEGKDSHVLAKCLYDMGKSYLKLGKELGDKECDMVPEKEESLGEALSALIEARVYFDQSQVMHVSLCPDEPNGENIIKCLKRLGHCYLAIAEVRQSMHYNNIRKESYSPTLESTAVLNPMRAGGGAAATRDLRLRRPRSVEVVDEFSPKEETHVERLLARREAAAALEAMTKK